MSADFIVRLIGMVVFAIIGVSWGLSLGRLANVNPGPSTFSVEWYAFTIGLVGALVGLVLTPFITTRPIRSLRKVFARVSAQVLIFALIGLVVGLIIAALLTFPLSLLPVPFGRVLPFLGVLIFGYFGIAIFVMRQTDLSSLIRLTPGKSGEDASASSQPPSRTILLDTSVIIDGRIADIAPGI